jgi:hypothetical protein
MGARVRRQGAPLLVAAADPGGVPPYRGEAGASGTVHRIRPRTYERNAAELSTSAANEANGKREQALAALFYRSNWTQEELAKKEGKGKSWISQRLVFGRFLSFAANSTIVEKLTEGRFRAYWDRTAEHVGDSPVCLSCRRPPDSPATKPRCSRAWRTVACVSVRRSPSLAGQK